MSGPKVGRAIPAVKHGRKGTFELSQKLNISPYFSLYERKREKL